MFSIRRRLRLVIHWLICPADECPGIDKGTSPPDFLSTSERATYAKLAFPKRRREWLLGRWTAKRLLQLSQEAYRLLALNAITVGNDPDGAPFLSVDGEGRLPVSLSISHREERAFCALSPSLSPPIGADVERVEARDLAFVRLFFTPDEAERVWACPPSTRDTLITVIWSAKEAVLKALHQGLRVDTRSVEVRRVAGLKGDTAPRSSSTCRAPDDWRELTISSRLPGAAHIVAWWRRDGGYVLTLAATSPTPIALAINRARDASQS